MRTILRAAALIWGLSTLLFSARLAYFQSRLPTAHTYLGVISPYQHLIQHGGYYRPTEMWDVFEVDLQTGIPRRTMLNHQFEAAADWTPGGEWVVFSRRSYPGGYEVYRVRALGGPEQQLTDCADDNNFPDISPDGRWIVYQSDCAGYRALYKMRLDGRAKERLTDNWPMLGVVGFQTWSPDGEWILFVGHDGTDEEVYRLRADGGPVQQLTDNDVHDSFPAWSPDMRWITWIQQAEPVRGDGLLAARQATWQVHIMRPDGMDKRQLTASARYSLSPQVSPDGEWVAYVDTWYEYDKSELRKVRVDGTEDTLLHPHGWLPVWSPDGEQLAFLEAKRNLAVMAPDGSDLRLLGSLAVREPVWIVRGRPDHFYGLLLAGGGMMAGAPLLANITSRWLGKR